ncbi:MAG: RNA polymerase sigma factor [Polyangiales bacterium]|nr:RNA polymerase sigma factor [Myxococcales bacterium]MCB9656817.1 RNA polymerase sigma factor [Sandaracinaceae bacterium]
MLDDDAALVRAVRRGERALFATLVQRYNQRLFRVARGIVRSDSDAEDVVQESHLAAFQHLHQLEDPAHYGAWVTRIAIRAALARARGQQRHGAMLASEPPAPSAPAVDPETALATTTLRAQLEAAIDALDDAQRVVFMLRAVQEVSTAEAAEALGVSEENVRVRLHRARAALRSELRDAPWPSAYAFLGERCARMTRAVMGALVDPAEQPSLARG